METSNLIFLLAQTVMLIIGGYFAFRRMKSQGVVEDSTAANNYYKLVLQLQKKVAGLEDLLGRSHLEMTVEIEMGKSPIITSYKWLRREDDIPAAVE